MFSTCIFCHASLGANQIIEHFPVGKRLAFDPERGRLWAVCPKCTRWNLTPIEERWEALEECERAYRGTRTRVSTDNIALARLRDGTDLVRIGRPLLPELATWRYGSQLRSRRRAYAASTVGVVAVGLGGWALATYSVLLLVGAGSVGTVGQVVYSAVRGYQRRRAVGWLPAPPDHRHSYGTNHVDTARISVSPENVLSLSMDYRVRGPRGSFLNEDRTLQLTGDDASTLFKQVIVHVNRSGASRLDIADAVREVEQRRASHELVTDASRFESYGARENVGLLSALPPRLRIGLEISVHQEDERRAMAGELGALYARWEEAERIAKIADGALSPVPHAADR